MSLLGEVPHDCDDVCSNVHLCLVIACLPGGMLRPIVPVQCDVDLVPGGVGTLQVKADDSFSLNATPLSVCFMFVVLLLLAAPPPLPPRVLHVCRATSSLEPHCLHLCSLPCLSRCSLPPGTSHL